MDIGEHEECPEEMILLCDIEGCNRKAVGRIGNEKLCDLHIVKKKGRKKIG